MLRENHSAHFAIRLKIERIHVLLERSKVLNVTQHTTLRIVYLIHCTHATLQPLLCIHFLRLMACFTSQLMFRLCLAIFTSYMETSFIMAIIKIHTFHKICTNHRGMCEYTQMSYFVCFFMDVTVHLISNGRLAVTHSRVFRRETGEKYIVRSFIFLYIWPGDIGTIK
jgi:hypothetical protein